MVDLVDEFRHEPGDEQLWNESWYFDVVAPDCSWGMYARLGLYPNLAQAWWWAVVVRQGEPLLLVRDHTLDLPKTGSSFEVRGDGLWADVHCHEAMQRWQVNFEGVAVALDDPTEAYRSERGDRVAVEFEFDWEAVAPWFAYPGVARYEQSCVVTGDVQIKGDESLSLVTPVAGQRDHSWGLRDWWSFPWVWTAGALDDGTRFHASRPEIDGVKYEPGYVVRDGQLVGGLRFDVDVIEGPDGLPSTTTMNINGLDLVARPQLVGGVAMESPDGRVGLLHRAASTFTTGDGREGVGWMEWNLPPRF